VIAVSNTGAATQTVNLTIVVTKQPQEWKPAEGANFTSPLPALLTEWREDGGGTSKSRQVIGG
jgi:hypothetical protein